MPEYSGTPLARKLGIAAGMRVRAVGAPPEYRAWLGPVPEGVTLASRVSTSVDLVHHFSTSRTELARALTGYRERLAAETPVWVSWPKKSSGVPTDITEDVIRELALPLGFVDVKVCAVSEVWSGLKLVVRRALR